MNDIQLDDELSIDSKTDKKIQIKTQDKHDDRDEVASNSLSKSSTSAKPHFRIDWRQLTYYKKERRSLASHLLCSKQTKPSQLQHHHQQQQQSIYFDDDELEQDEASSADGSGQSYYGGGGDVGRLSRASSGKQGGQSKRRPILNSLDGCFKSGELSAILGPSGAGKSTFLSALFGNKQESSYGQTKVTWFPSQTDQCAQPTEPLNTKRSVRIAILPQQDHLLNHLTVYETLMFASKIKNPHKANCKSFHSLNVKRVAKTLKLTECLQTRCGRLSGGQYKRVSIGQELLSEPDVIILDEPTSGLDAMTCLTTVRTLKSIVLKHPISIILTIHQPDIDVFNLFDQVYVIAQGGLAIYEGPPSGVVPTLAQVDLLMPSENYNPARFIVENAFVSVPEEGVDSLTTMNTIRNRSKESDDDDDGSELVKANKVDGGVDCQNETENESDDDSDEDKEDQNDSSNKASNFFRQSLSSITGALSGQLTKAGDLSVAPNGAASLVSGKRNDKRFRDSGRRPLLNIGIQTADGKLITSDQLTTTASSLEPSSRSATLNLENEMRKQTLERMRILRRLNQIQKERYYNGTATLSDGSFISSDVLSQQTSLSLNDQDRNTQHEIHSVAHRCNHHLSSGCTGSVTGGGGGGRPLSIGSRNLAPASPVDSSSSSTWAEARDQIEDGDHLERASTLSATSSDQHRDDRQRQHFVVNLSTQSSEVESGHRMEGSDISPATTIEVNSQSASGPIDGSGFSHRTDRRSHTHIHLDDELHHSSCTSRVVTGGGILRGPRVKLRRQFDKRLSAKRVQSKQGDHPIWYHSFLLTHRTWLSIVRDPVFFGIQFAMHTTIPILLALIFGSQQEEGCPRVGNFDLVEFAYADERSDFLQGTMRSIRKSIGNIGVVFFEMFVLSFAINCITALVFPLDMYVLLKEHRNGWYSLKSYFFGRTLADLPVPIVLHSMAMCILCYMTGQPLSCWRFAAVIGIVILASLVAQSVGLTIGALLMRSSQSAVLAAAGIVAPFFALSGFIVRIHTLPWIAQWAAQGSYLYHLLNGFIIMRYGFGRCPCSEQDFEMDEAHKIPGNIKTMASMWVGTYSNEFESSQQMVAHLNEHQRQNRTNIDPNIDIIDKLMGAFKMANSFGHKVDNCNDVVPYAMLDFNLHDSDIWHCCLSLVVMLIVSRFITFSAIYYKIRSFS